MDSPLPLAVPEEKLRPSYTRDLFIIATLALAGTIAAFLHTILIPIQGQLPVLLNTKQANTAWVITATLLVASLMSPISGKLGDMFGKRRIAICLLGILIVGSVTCAFTSSFPVFLIGRALQGAGMGIAPIGIALLYDLLPRDRVAGAVALVSATLSLGAAIGLPVSATFVRYFDWHYLFLIAAALGGVSLVAMFAIVPKDRIASGGSVDIVGAVGLAVFLTTVLLAVTQGNAWGWGDAKTIGCAIVGVVSCVLWCKYELGRNNPLVDLRLCAQRPVFTTNIASAAMGFALFASSIAFPQILQLPVAQGGQGILLVNASLLLMPAGVAMFLTSPVAGRAQHRWGARSLLFCAASILTAAYGAASVIPLTPWIVCGLNTIIGIGVGFGYAAMPALIIGAVPKALAASANGINMLMRGFGTTVASAVVGAMLAAAPAASKADMFTLVFLIGGLAAVIAAIGTYFIPKQSF